MSTSVVVPDLTDPDLYAHGDPHTVWRTLREHAPVYRQSVGDGLGFRAVTRYADVARVARDHDVFGPEQGAVPDPFGIGDPAVGQRLAATDPLRPDRMRVLLDQALRARPIRARADDIRSGIRALLPPDGDPFDLAEAMKALPLVVIGALLGLPEDDRPRLAHLALMAFAGDDPDYRLPEGPAATVRRAHRELFAYFGDLVRYRVRRPRDDLIGTLLGLRHDGERLSPDAVVVGCHDLLLGAGVPLSQVPGAAVLELARTGGYAAWANRPDLLDSGVEEALRWSTPANHLVRITRRPVELSGVWLPEGATVVAFLGSADRDDRVFAAPDMFDVARRSNRHLAFGAGRRSCVGSSTARPALRLLFGELFATYASLEVVGEPVRLRSTFLAGLKRLPVRGRPRPGTRPVTSPSPRGGADRRSQSSDIAKSFRA